MSLTPLVSCFVLGLLVPVDEEHPSHLILGVLLTLRYLMPLLQQQVNTTSLKGSFGVMRKEADVQPTPEQLLAVCFFFYVFEIVSESYNTYMYTLCKTVGPVFFISVSRCMSWPFITPSTGITTWSQLLWSSCSRCSGLHHQNFCTCSSLLAAFHKPLCFARTQRAVLDLEASWSW